MCCLLIESSLDCRTSRSLSTRVKSSFVVNFYLDGHRYVPFSVGWSEDGRVGLLKVCVMSVESFLIATSICSFDPVLELTWMDSISSDSNCVQLTLRRGLDGDMKLDWVCASSRITVCQSSLLLCPGCPGYGSDCLDSA